MATRPNLLSAKTGEGHFPQADTVQMFTKFHENINLLETKRIGKLLQVVSSEGCLVSDYKTVVGISKVDFPGGKAITVRFENGVATVHLGQSAVCSIIDGQFRCAKSVDVSATLKNILHDVPDKCLELAAYLVDSAINNKHGCTIVIDLRSPHSKITGENLNPAIVRSDSSSIVQQMAKVDGAVHINREGEIVSFGCLLDGTASATEDRARGARFNSALRYCESNTEQVYVVVASSDGPISIFGKGKILYEDPFSKADSPPQHIHIAGKTAELWLANTLAAKSTEPV